ncbi:DUF1129 family protein [Fructilactobacillus florum]|uniref:DUF1129 family protein n=1 Tax=Fructilactobacillus florum TaxID=640331 RepID=UPI000A42087E|nr:DUF1129 family protein [Fructilactobacillus florum]
MYGSVANKVENTVHPPQQPQGPLTRKNYLIDAIYNGLWFLILFNFLYAAMYYLTPAAAKQDGAAGITCIILSSVVAGAGMPIVTQLFAPGVKHRQNALLRSLLMVAMFAVWMVVFYGSNLLPRVVNPVVPPIINLIIGLVGTGLMLFMRARYTITSGLFAGRK